MTKKEKATLFVMFVSLLPFVLGVISLYANYSTLLANVDDLKDERLRISEKLDTISTKLDTLNGQIQEHFRGN